MASLQFTFREGNSLDVIVLDATLSERHSFEADVTDSPVENGANVSDNVRKRPETLTLDGFISDFPLPVNGLTKLPTGVEQLSKTVSTTLSRSAQVLGQLRRLQTEGVLVTVNTGVSRYDSMVLQSIEIPRDKQVANGLRVSLTFRQIKIVETKSVTVQRAQTNKGKGKVALGKQEKKTTTQAEGVKVQELRSAASAGFDAALQGVQSFKDWFKRY